MASIVVRDGKPVSPILSDEAQAERWLQQHQGMSNDWAKAHGGYAVVDTASVDPGDLPRAYLKSGMRLERMPSSAAGNPRFQVSFDDGSAFATKPDASVGYAIQNREWHGRDVTVYLDGHGQIIGLRDAAGRIAGVTE